jgi:hypothetical protein
MRTGPTDAELDALTAWWKAQRHIGKAAMVLHRHRQRVANNLMSFRRLEGATDNVELAMKYLDQIEQRWPDVLKRAA